MGDGKGEEGMKILLFLSDAIIQMCIRDSYYRGNKLVLINKSATPMDSRADLIIHESIGKVFGTL